MEQVEKSFLRNEGGCRDGVNYEKGCQQEDASADNKKHISIPTSFFIYIFLYSHNLYCDNYDVNDVFYDK